MPELPEVETTRRGISPHINGKKVKQLVVRNAALRWPVPTDLPLQVKGRVLQDIQRRGKYLLFCFDNGTALSHLGMSGNMRIVPAKTEILKHDHIDWIFSDNTVLRFNDPRRFGALLWTDEPIESHELIAHLGPEPLDTAFNSDYLYTKSRKRVQSIKTFLMDSRTVVGVGNIYANEALFSSGIHPLKPAGKLSRPKCETLVDEVKRILNHAITRGGTTLKDFVGGDGKPGYFAQELNVYGRGGEACKLCGKALTEKRLGQRTTVYCTNCQR